jgi:diguanylate cyclase (GGDEF)-like protein
MRWYSVRDWCAGALTQRWLTALGFFLALAMMAAGLAIMADMRAGAWRNAGKAVDTLVGDLTRDLAHNIGLYDQSLQGVRQIMEQPDIGLLSPETRHMALFNRTASSDYLGAMLVLDANGDVVADTRSPHPAPVNMADRDFFLAHRDRADLGLFISAPYRSKLRQGDWSIAIGRRIARPDGGFGGIVSGALRLAYFDAILGKPDIGPHGAITLYRSDGLVMMRYPSRDEVIGLNRRDDPLFRRIASAPSGVLTAASEDDGITRLYAFRRVGDLPLIGVAGLAVEDIYAGWLPKAAAIGVALIVLGAASAVLCVLFTRTILRREAAEAEIRATADRLEIMAATDALTQLANRRAFDTALDAEWRRTIRGGAAISLLLLDADHFKLFNDRYGHPMGDTVLCGIASCIRDNLRRPGDLGSRVGGEEFAVLLPETGLPGALTIAEAIRSALAALEIPHADNPGGRVTVSIGAAVLRPSIGDTAATLVALADKALYEAKRNGRNRVMAAGEVAGLAEAAAYVALSQGR